MVNIIILLLFDGWMNGWMDGLMDEWMDGWTDGRADGRWTDVRTRRRIKLRVWIYQYLLIFGTIFWSLHNSSRFYVIQQLIVIKDIIVGNTTWRKNEMFGKGRKPSFRQNFYFLFCHSFVLPSAMISHISIPNDQLENKVLKIDQNSS